MFHLAPGHPDDGPALCAVEIDSPSGTGEALPLSARLPIARMQLSPPPDAGVRARAAARPWGGEPTAAAEDADEGRCRPALQCSASGRFVSTTLPAAAGAATRIVVAHLEVLSVGSGGAVARKGRLTPVWDGPGAAIAWHSSEDLCVIMDPPPSQLPGGKGKARGPPVPSATAALTSSGAGGGEGVVLRSVSLAAVAAVESLGSDGGGRRREAEEVGLRLRGDLAAVHALFGGCLIAAVGPSPAAASGTGALGDWRMQAAFSSLLSIWVLHIIVLCCLFLSRSLPAPVCKFVEYQRAVAVGMRTDTIDTYHALPTIDCHSNRLCA